ncbi:hypothetical protein FQV39_30435 (plasmid) [Bosea sp. F3-2]|uniref:hypothetical protein n=1 Tax=Bosea sp. F3-2 TaxID=2599640 RepID=UPI0011EECEAC|nr:hypothetical protein [Bosea sp. F3-2]QEL26970.1 hypothetical protein FQV39_30435 [Bosea sp. F3-2]
MSPKLLKVLRGLFAEAQEVSARAVVALGPATVGVTTVDAEALAAASYRLQQLAREIVAVQDTAER